MAIYRFEGVAKKSGVPAEALVVLYEGNRSDLPNLGNELGRTVSEPSSGLWAIDTINYVDEAYVVVFDLDTLTKYQAVANDRLLATELAQVYGSYDEVFYSVVSLLHLDGTPGSHVYTDVVPARSWTDAGSAVLANNPKYGTTSVSLPGAGSYVQHAHDAAIGLTGDCAIDLWVYISSVTTVHGVWHQGSDASTSDRFQLVVNSNGSVTIYCEDSVGVKLNSTSGAGLITSATWHLISVAKNDLDIEILIDGSSVLTATMSGEWASANYQTRIGYAYDGTVRGLGGYADDWRLTKGVFRYSGNRAVLDFAWPNQNYDDYLGSVVSLLNFSGMPNGTTITDFVVDRVWTAINGATISSGVLLLDGTNDYIELTDELHIRDEFNGNLGNWWTIDYKIKIKDVASEQTHIDWRGAFDTRGLRLYQDAATPTKLTLSAGDSASGWEGSITSTDTFAANDIVEVAISRELDDYYLHLNGVYQGKFTTSVILNLGSTGMLFGISRDLASHGLFAELYRFRMTVSKNRFAEATDYTPRNDNFYADEVTPRLPVLALTNQIVNGDFETGNFTGWDATGGGVIVNAADAVRVFGTYGMRGGTSNATSWCYQIIDIPVGVTRIVVESWLARNHYDSDDPEINIQWLDSGSANLGIERQIGLLEFGYDNQERKQLLRQDLQVPEGAAKVRIRAMARRYDGSSNNAGHDDVALYFDPPPLTTPTSDPLWANVESLLLFTESNGSTTTSDEVAGNSWTFNGSAQITTSQAKYGTGCLSLSAAGSSYITTTSLPVLSGDFTIELWVMFNSLAANTPIFFAGDINSDANLFKFGINETGDFEIIRTTSSGAVLLPTTNFQTGVWYHFAVIYYGTTNVLFVNGKYASTYNQANGQEGGVPLANIDIALANFYLGRGRYASSNAHYLDGYIDNFRMTAVVPRYKHTFTAPDKAFPNS